jgi:hypothetical protein
VIYVGDSNVTVGKPFKIQCLSKVPIEWHKDDQPIHEDSFSNDDTFGYVKSDVTKENNMAESTLSVNHALLRHSGKYKCNINHKNSHALYVNENQKPVEISVDEDDHLEVRVSFEPPIEEEREELKSTMMALMEDWTERSGEISEEDSIEDVLTTEFTSTFEPIKITTTMMTSTTKMAELETEVTRTTTQELTTQQSKTTTTIRPKGSRLEKTEIPNLKNPSLID